MSTKVNFTNRIDLDPAAIKSKLVASSAISGEYEIVIEADLSDIALTGEFIVVLTHKALGETNRYELPGQNELNINITHPLH